MKKRVIAGLSSSIVALATLASVTPVAQASTPFKCHVDAMLFIDHHTINDNNTGNLYSFFDTTSAGLLTFETFVDVQGLNNSKHKIQLALYNSGGKTIANWASASFLGTGNYNTTTWHNVNLPVGTVTLRAYVDGHYIGYSNLAVHN